MVNDDLRYITCAVEYDDCLSLYNSITVSAGLKYLGALG